MSEKPSRAPTLLESSSAKGSSSFADSALTLTSALVASSPKGSRCQAQVCQDFSSAAQQELSSSVRRQNTDEICRSLSVAVRQKVPPEDLEVALRTLALLVRRTYVREAETQSSSALAAEQLKAAHGKLDSLGKALLDVREELRGLRDRGSSCWPGGMASPSSPTNRTILVEESDVKDLSTPELRAALLKARADSEQIKARLVLLQDEVLRRLASKETE